MSHPLETLWGRRGAVATGELKLRPTPAGTYSCRRRRRAGSPQEVRGVLAGPEEGQPFLAHTAGAALCPGRPRGHCVLQARWARSCLSRAGAQTSSLQERPDVSRLSDPSTTKSGRSLGGKVVVCESWSILGKNNSPTLVKHGARSQSHTYFQKLHWHQKIRLSDYIRLRWPVYSCGPRAAGALRDHQ